ncbi:MAG: ATP-binding protein [Hydrogenophaga sp.]|uniref:ATP-binding protein n=1 Tax=Hydrogenophaga sp. TaxID=1904254 RepID=UPI004035BA9F
MNVFVAGVHGVGKSYLCEKAAPLLGITHASASKLIREQLALPAWNTNKLVTDIQGNQRALIAAIQRYSDEQSAILLDGHFLLRDASGQLTEIPDDVFSSLNLAGVVVLEKELEVIRRQVAARDGHSPDAEPLLEAMLSERRRAEDVCNKLALPLEILNDPKAEEFGDVISRFLKLK